MEAEEEAKKAEVVLVEVERVVGAMEGMVEVAREGGAMAGAVRVGVGMEEMADLADLVVVEARWEGVAGSREEVEATVDSESLSRCGRAARCSLC